MSRIQFSNLTSTGFEEFCFHLLRRLGFSNLDWRKGTPRESSPADSGRDIVAFQQREDVDGARFHDNWFIDCKHYRRAVPPTELQAALSWAEAEHPNVLLFIASGYFSNPAKDYLEKYRQNRKPFFRIKTWEYPQLTHVIGGRRSLLRDFDLVKDKGKTRSMRQILRAEEEYFNKIWYGRHKGTSEAEMRLWDPEIRRGAKASAGRVEKKYGKRNLIAHDDFEWGMFNGKLSALRWVLGDDWDMLDT
jgi:hypothetical protein